MRLSFPSPRGHLEGPSLFSQPFLGIYHVMVLVTQGSGVLFPSTYCHCWEHSINEHVIFKYKHIYVYIYIYMWQPKKRCRKIENSGIPSWKYCSIFLGFLYLHMSENKKHIKLNHRHIFNHQHVISLKPMMFSPCWNTCSFSMGNYIAVIFNALIC